MYDQGCRGLWAQPMCETPNSRIKPLLVPDLSCTNPLTGQARHDGLNLHRVLNLVLHPQSTARRTESVAFAPCFLCVFALVVQVGHRWSKPGKLG